MAQARRTPRIPCSVPGRIEAAQGPIRGLVKSLSRGGLFFLGRKTVPVGQSVEMLIELPGRGPVRGWGEVRYHHGSVALGEGMGIKFVRLGGEDLATIAGFVDAKKP